jgi:hypothetical protein
MALTVLVHTAFDGVIVWTAVAVSVIGYLGLAVAGFAGRGR